MRTTGNHLAACLIATPTAQTRAQQPLTRNRMRTAMLLALIAAVGLLSPIAHAAWPQQAKLTADDGIREDRFGYSVSVSGDYAVVGADLADVGSPFDDNDQSKSGSAYIYQRTGSAWTQTAKLTADDAAASDFFGRSVSIDGDYAVVGAEGDDDNGANSGSAYIFHRTDSAWTQQAKLTADDGAQTDVFACSVSISGDYAVVGAIGDDDNGEMSGSAYIFQRTGSAWTQQAKLTADDGEAEDFFGRSVSIDGDYAIVGADFDDDNGNASGSAYIFEKPDGGWADMTQTAKLTADDGAEADFFGGSVSIDGDYAVVGAHQDSDAGSHSGSAYVFERTGSAWTQQAKLTADDAEAVDYFGGSVAVSGDCAVVGASGDDDNGWDSGSAYIFERTGSSWTQTAKLLPDDGAAFDGFGNSIAISGDYAVVGADRDDDNGDWSGSAYVFTPEPGTLSLLALGSLVLLKRKRRRPAAHLPAAKEVQTE